MHDKEDVDFIYWLISFGKADLKLLYEEKMQILSASLKVLVKQAFTAVAIASFFTIFYFRYFFLPSHGPPDFLHFLADIWKISFMVSSPSTARPGYLDVLNSPLSRVFRAHQFPCSLFFFNFLFSLFFFVLSGPSRFSSFIIFLDFLFFTC